MNAPYLEVTFRRGKPLAAYLYLPRREGDRTASSEPVEDSLVIDRSADGRVIGLEIINPGAVSADRVNGILRQLQQPELPIGELAPLRVA
ncbi:MAG: DUF2283 domain-containing protein [Phycisphaerales bacterium]|jgi:uncharacterized protein YuzE|nr:DUF2283 domain-containing protein [Phycisphaerales bacterium]